MPGLSPGNAGHLSGQLEAWETHWLQVQVLEEADKQVGLSGRDYARAVRAEMSTTLIVVLGIRPPL